MSSVIDHPLMAGAHAVTACRACGGALGAVFCDLGTMPVANAYLRPEQAAKPEPAYPLRALVCTGCRLVQLDTVVDETGIFTDYAYFSSASRTWIEHAARYCADITQRLGLGAHSFVVEVASNDGYLLRNFVAAGIPCLGIEPAANVAATARAAGIPTQARFFGRAVAAELLERRGGRPADLVIGNNVLAHVPDLDDFIGGLALLAGATGTVTIESPHLLALVDGVQFDTIYHEHYAYWSLLSVERALGRHGLLVHDIEHLPTHGGSLRIHAAARAREPGAALVALRAEEARRGLDGDAFYQGFEARAAEVVAGLRAWIAEAKRAGRRIAAYGAAAKGNTMLNAAGITAADLLAVADLSPAKQGRLLPGSHVPVVTPEALLALQPDDILILPWNIAGEISRQLREAGFAGGLVTAVPRILHHATEGAAPARAIEFRATDIPGVVEILASPAFDARGAFLRSWSRAGFAAAGIDFVPTEVSMSENPRRHTLRGLHYQAPPAEEAKLVRCLRGAAHDVALDLRADSPTYGRCFATVLSAEARNAVFIPRGCAHGFLTLVDDTVLEYMIDTPYAPDLARGVRWDDPAFGIAWPAAPAVISPKDRAWPDHG